MLGPPMNLCGAEEHRVLVCRGVGHAAPTPAVHLDVDVGRRSGVVPEREGAVLVEEGGDRVGVGDDARDVARGREGADEERALGVLDESLPQHRDVDVAVEVLRDDDDVGDALTPHDLVGVVLVGADEDDRALVGGDEIARVPTVLEVRRDAQSEDADELVDGPGAARTGEDDHRLVVTADGVTDRATGVLAQPGRLQARARALGVGVGVAGEHLVADEVLDEGQAATRGGVVGVGDPSRAVGPVHHLVLADDPGADGAEKVGLRCCLHDVDHSGW